MIVKENRIVSGTHYNHILIYSRYTVVCTCCYMRMAVWSMACVLRQRIEFCMTVGTVVCIIIIISQWLWVEEHVCVYIHKGSCGV